VSDELEAVIPQEVPTTDSFPWPPQPGESALDAFAATWKEACFHPTSFYRRMPLDAPFKPVLLYYMIIGVMAAGLQLFWSTLFQFLNLAGPAENLFGARSATSPLVDFLLSPIITFVALYLVTGVCHLVLTMARGANEGFEASSRVFAFSYSPVLFGIVPFVGNFVGFVWMVVLAIIGLRETHRTSTGRASAAVLVPVFLLFCLLVLAVLLAMAAGLLSEAL
jgi:hypothetical protein